MTKEEAKEDKKPTYDRKFSKNFTTDEAGVDYLSDESNPFHVE